MKFHLVSLLPWIFFKKREKNRNWYYQLKIEIENWKYLPLSRFHGKMKPWFPKFLFFHQKIILHGHFSDHDFSSFTKWNQKKWKIAPIQKQHSRESFCKNHGLFQIPLANPIFTFLVKPQVWKLLFFYVTMQPGN